MTRLDFPFPQIATGDLDVPIVRQLPAANLQFGDEFEPGPVQVVADRRLYVLRGRIHGAAAVELQRDLNRCLTRPGCDHHMKTGATVAAFARPVRFRPVDRRSTPCLSPIAPRTSSLAVQTQRRRLRRTRPERSARPEPEPTSSGPWQPREPMLPDDRDFGPAMVIDQMSLSKVCFAEFSPDSQDSATSIQRGK